MRSASLAAALVAAGGMLFVAACTEDSPLSPVVDEATSVGSPLSSTVTGGVDGSPSSSSRSFAERLVTREELTLLGDGHCLVEMRVPGGQFARRHGRVPQMRPEGADASHLRTLPVYTMDGRLLFRVTCRTLAGEEGVELMVARFVKLTIYRRSGALVSGTGSAPSAAVSGLGIEGAALVVGGDSATAVVVGGSTAASTSIDDPCDPDFDGVGLCVEVSRCDEENGEFYDAWDDECVCATGWPCDDGSPDSPSDPLDDPDGGGGGGGGTGDGTNEPPPDCDETLDASDGGCEDPCELDPLAEGCECSLDPAQLGCPPPPGIDTNYWDQLTEWERAMCIAHLLECATVAEETMWALAWTNQQHGVPVHPNGSGPRDAIRHCYWSARLHHSMSTEAAERWLFTHEVHVLDTPESDMDFHNNDVGAEIASTHDESQYGAQCLAALDAGLLEILNDPGS